MVARRKPQPQSSNGGGQTSKWTSTEIRILEAARKIIANKGYSKFSMRSIASGAGIHLKSLQYYFPSKKVMLDAVVSYTIEHYYFEEYLKQFESHAAVTPRQRLDVMLDYLIDDLSNPFTSRFFPELWALATRDKDMTAALDHFYQSHLASLQNLFAEVNPALNRETAALKATVVGMLIEGLVLIMGHGKPAHPERVNLAEFAKGTVLQIIESPSPFARSRAKQGVALEKRRRVPHRRQQGK